MSTLKADTIQSPSGGAATLTKQSAQKAYVSYNMDGTAGIDNSLNMSTLTDNGTGDATLTITNAFENKFMVIAVSGGDSGISDSGLFNLTIQDETTERTSSTFRAQYAFVNATTNKTVDNKTYQNASVNGDLA